MPGFQNDSQKRLAENLLASEEAITETLKYALSSARQAGGTAGHKHGSRLRQFERLIDQARHEVEHDLADNHPPEAHGSTIQARQTSAVIVEAHQEMQPLMDRVMAQMGADDGFVVSPEACLSAKAEQALHSLNLNSEVAELARDVFELVGIIGRLHPQASLSTEDQAPVEAAVWEHLGAALGDEQDLSDTIRSECDGALAFLRGWVAGNIAPDEL